MTTSSDTGRQLPQIPFVDLETNGFEKLAKDHRERVGQLLKIGHNAITRDGVKWADRLSEKWASKGIIPFRQEIDSIANLARQPGAWLINLNFEWGCTVGIVRNAAKQVCMIRAMDWPTPGLGKLLMAVRRVAPAGSYLSLTWAGFAGCIQGVAPGRFAASINAAPRRNYGLGSFSDWPAARLAVWQNHNTPPQLLLRRAFEECKTFAEARTLIKNTPISIPAIFTLVGTTAEEYCVIEKIETVSTVIEKKRAVANHWLGKAFPGLPKQPHSKERAEAMGVIIKRPIDGLEWPVKPIINPDTRLVMHACAETGAVSVRGYEADGPVTQVLTVVCEPAPPPVEEDTAEGAANVAKPKTGEIRLTPRKPSPPPPPVSTDDEDEL